MSYEQFTLKDKAKNLAMVVVILEAAALLINFIVYFGQNLVFKYYYTFSDPDRYHVPFGIFMLNRIGAIIVLVFYVIYFVVVSNAVYSLRSKGVLFTVLKLVLSNIVLSGASYIAQLIISEFYGVFELGGSSMLNSAITLFASPLTSVASALFYISCGYLIASEHMAMANYANNATYMNSVNPANVAYNANNTNI